MTASSFHNGDYRPSYGRLNDSRSKGGWCPKTLSDRTDYLQVDMGEVRFLCGVATQGLQGSSAWATSYKLQLSTDGITWNIYKETNIEKVRRELYVIDVFRNQEFEVNANYQLTDIHLDSEFGHLSSLATAAENNVGDCKLLYNESACTTSYKLHLSTDDTTWNTQKETNIEKMRMKLQLLSLEVMKEFEVNTK